MSDQLPVGDIVRRMIVALLSCPLEGDGGIGRNCPSIMPVSAGRHTNTAVSGNLDEIFFLLTAFWR
jgi:hypothetical protein